MLHRLDSVDEYPRLGTPGVEYDISNLGLELNGVSTTKTEADNVSRLSDNVENISDNPSISATPTGSGKLSPTNDNTLGHSSVACGGQLRTARTNVDDASARSSKERSNTPQLSPALWLWHAAQLDADATAIHHTTANGSLVRRTYRETADRARGLAYYLRSKGLKRVGIFCPNTPAFLESVFAIAASGGVSIAINYQSSANEIVYMFNHVNVDSIIVDAEYMNQLSEFCENHPGITLIVDDDTVTNHGVYNEAIIRGLNEDALLGGRGWSGLGAELEDENSLVSMSFSSGSTHRPECVSFTHRGAHLEAMMNVIESKLNISVSTADRCRYLWALPMFHDMTWSFLWAVTAVRGTHFTRRKIDYPTIWKLLQEEDISHYSGAPSINTLLCADSNARRLKERVCVITTSPCEPTGLIKTMENLNLYPTTVLSSANTHYWVGKSILDISPYRWRACSDAD